MMIDQFHKCYDDLEHNVTKIAGRRRLTMIYDLAFFSVRKLPWKGNTIRGHLDVGVFGKTREGKSSIIERLLRHYQVGELISGENVTPAGLVGGVDGGSDGIRLLRWGKIPANNRRLLVIDEAHNLSCDQFRNMNSLRSSGIADIQKIKSGKTMAETRKIWIANPRLHQMDAYPKPLDMIIDIIGADDTLSRFDLLTVVAAQEQEWFTDSLEHVFTSPLCRSAILWAWGLGPEDIDIPEETYEAASRMAAKQIKEYTTDVPIILDHEQPERIMRIAAAIAAKAGSTGKDFKRLTITPEHVVTADFVMRYMLDDKALNYKEYVKVFRKYGDMIAERGAQIATQIREKIPDYKTLLKVFFKGEEIGSTQTLYQLLTGCSYTQFRALMSMLEELRFMTHTRFGVKPTPAFVRFIRAHFLEEMNAVEVDLSKMLEVFHLKESEDF